MREGEWVVSKFKKGDEGSGLMRMGAQGKCENYLKGRESVTRVDEPAWKSEAVDNAASKCEAMRWRGGRDGTGWRGVLTPGLRLAPVHDFAACPPFNLACHTELSSHNRFTSHLPFYPHTKHGSNLYRTTYCTGTKRVLMWGPLATWAGCYSFQQIGRSTSLGKIPQDEIKSILRPVST